MAVFGFFAVILWVGPLLDCSHIFLMLSQINWSGMLATFISGFYVNFTQAICTGLVMLFLGRPLLDKLNRIRLKYGMLENESDR
jgi:energy-coupling factor transport system substrate-specific component